MEVEYRVKPVTRYIITRFHSDGRSGGVEECGEFRNGNSAYTVARALSEFERHANPDAKISAPTIGDETPESEDLS